MQEKIELQEKKERVQDIITENSKYNNANSHERLVVESIDVADTDEIVGEIIKQKFVDSLSYQVCDVQPLHGPTGAVFGLHWDGTKVHMKKENVEVDSDPLIDTGFTIEALQDMYSQFGKNGIGYCTEVMRGISAQAENTKLMNFIDANAEDKGTITLSDPNNAETVFFEIARKVGDSLVQMNHKKNTRTLEGFAIIPLDVAGALVGLNIYFDPNYPSTGLFIGKINGIKYFVNPIGGKSVYVGLNPEISGSSSIIFSPYQHSITSAVNPDSGETNLFMINRYTHTLSTLDDIGTRVLHKYDI